MSVEMATKSYTEQKLHPAVRKVPPGKIPYLYLTGASYCGSTLLAFLLNAHPAVATVSEAGGPTRRVRVEEYCCSCGSLLLECPFFRELTSRINKRGTSFSIQKWQMEFQASERRFLNILLARPLRNVFIENVRDRVAPFWPGYRSRIETIARRNLHFVQAMLEITGKTAYLDAQKDSARIKFLREMEEFDIRVIHLIRDVRAGTASFMKNMGVPDPAKAAKLWLISNWNSERARRFVAPDRWMRLTYDELCEDPQGVRDRICEFAGIEKAPIPEDIYSCEHHIIGNRMRLKGTGKVRKDDSWTTRLSERDLQEIARVAGEANRHFGFPWP